MRLLCLFLLVVLAAPLRAHSPYFSDPLPCNDPRVEEFRFLFGDGITGPDPKAVVALDKAGRLLAFRNVGRGSVPLRRNACAVFDPKAMQIIELVEGDLEPELRLIGNDEKARGNRWKYEPGYKDDNRSFGFATKSADSSFVLDRLSWELRSYAHILGLSLVFYSGVGALIWLAVARRSNLSPLPRVMAGLLGFGLLLFLLFFSLIGLWFFPDRSAAYMVLSISLHGLALLAVAWLMHHLHPPSPPAKTP